MSGRISDPVCPKCGDPECPGPDANHHHDTLDERISDERLDDLCEVLRNTDYPVMSLVRSEALSAFEDAQRYRKLLTELMALSERTRYDRREHYEDRADFLAELETLLSAHTEAKP